jgi:lipopolysaccharide biosynthesis glycosyltransferase
MSASAPGPITLACAADDRFAMPLAVTLRSALDALSEPHRLEVHVLDGGIRRDNRVRLARSLDSPRLRLHFTTPPPDALGEIRPNRRFPAAAFYRLRVAELLPDSLARAIYLDADLVVVSDLARLWAEPFRGLPLLAVRDAGAPTVASPRGLRNHRELGLAPDQPYFNSGVLSIDLARWRQEKISEQLLRYLVTHADVVRWPDQDTLNAVLAGRFGELDPRWNQIPQVWEPATGDGDPFPAWLRERVIRDPWIVHYSTWSKPWHPRCTHPERERFFATLDRTAWAGWRPRKGLADLAIARQGARIARGAVRRLRSAGGRWLRRYYPSAHALGRLRFALAHRERRGLRPLLVHQMGKVGSSSVLEMLREACPDRDLFHVHFLAPESIAGEARMYRRRYPITRRIDEHHFASLHLRARLDADPGQRWQLVTLTRDPIARNLSAFFHNLAYAAPELFARVERGDDGAIADALRRQLEATPWWWRNPLEWFDRELAPVFGVDVFAQPFPRERGWAIHRSEHADVLVVRLEDLGRVAGEALRTFLGVSDVPSLRRNDSQRKPYAALYQQLARSLALDEEFLESIYGSRRTRHFYTDAEIAAFRAHWSRAGG